VHVWLISTAVPAAVVADLRSCLDEAELARAASFQRADHQRSYLVAHGAIRTILADRLGIAPSDVKWRAGAHGKPELESGSAGPAPQVSLSRSGGLAMFAMTAQRRVGVDLQHSEIGIEVVRMAERFFPPAEASYVASARPAEQASRFLRLWTRKEACVKVDGGLLLSGLRLKVLDTGTVAADDEAGTTPGPYRIKDVRPPGQCYAAVAVQGAEPFTVRTHHWPAEPS
jgi:4'-phosphopantetheinyl transferase